MKELLTYWLAQVVMLGSICLALHWIWQAWLLLIGVSYETDETDETDEED